GSDGRRAWTPLRTRGAWGFCGRGARSLRSARPAGYVHQNTRVAGRRRAETAEKSKARAVRYLQLTIPDTDSSRLADSSGTGPSQKTTEKSPSEIDYRECAAEGADR